MPREVDSAARTERDAFGAQAAALFARGRAADAHATARAEHAMPRQLAPRRELREQSAYQTRAAGEARLGRDLAVARDSAARDRVDRRENALVRDVDRRSFADE